MNKLEFQIVKPLEMVTIKGGHGPEIVPVGMETEFFEEEDFNDELLFKRRPIKKRRVG
ncbi:hypothetical protein [Leptobacterium sp. I13]|uniref:hypothetical protein n=1 Tax=Leptobacterium meishanense TaxID=3128904 RepID=UPI0030EC1BFE